MNKEVLFNKAASFISNIHEMEKNLAGDIQKNGLTPLQNNLLQVLYFSNPETLSSLSGCLNMNMPNTSREIKKLSEAGLVKKVHSDNDKRVTYLSLSGEGKGIIEKNLMRMKENFFNNSGEWPEARIKRVLDSISVLEQELFNTETEEQ